MKPVNISVIIPLYNNHELLHETLDSINNQILPSLTQEVIIVDDCSSSPETKTYLNKLKNKNYSNISELKIIHHKTNKWLAEARNTGVKNSSGKYICCIDPDDTIEIDYFTKAWLVLESHECAWVYPGVKRFGHSNSLELPPDFDARKFFFDNYSVSSSVFLRSAWEHVKGQKHWNISEEVKMYEDWDFLIRLMTKGYYGLPLKEYLFNYRQVLKSTMTRNWKHHLSSSYLVYRKNIFNLIKVNRANKKYYSENVKGQIPRKLSQWPFSFVDVLIGKSLTKILKHKIYPINSKILLQSFFRPQDFIKTIFNHNFLPTKAAQICGFISMPNIIHDTTMEVRNNSFFVQTHWEIGGAENVFLDWLKNFSNSYKGKIVNIAETKNIHDKGKLYHSFKSFSNEQYNLKTLGHNPLAKLMVAWNLILLYRPELIYIYHQPYFYILSPYIKKYLPKCTIIDILHVEDNENPGFFEIANEYKSFIDKRVVISEYWKKVLIERYKEEEEKINVVYNNIDISKFKPGNYNSFQLNTKDNLTPDTKKIGFIGRLNSQKRPLLFIKLAELFQDKTGFHFFMMGDGELKNEIEKRISQLPNISLIQANPNPQWFYELCDIMIFPSLFEGFPMVSLECAAMNTPFIATSIVGFKEQVEMGNIGKLIEFANDDHFLMQMESLILNDWDQLIELEKKGHSFIHSYLKEHDIPKQQLETLLK